MNNDKWAAAESLLGCESTEALKKLYNFYGDNIYKWFAALYEPEIGGFYYADSARDHEGFLPDIESTTQCLEMIYGSGMQNKFGLSFSTMGYSYPDSIREKIIHFGQSLQDEGDGYFYHPQWGKNIGSSRKGRDVNSAKGVIVRMGGKPLYPTGVERLAAAAKSKEAVPDSVPAYMTDREKLKEYLGTLDVNRDSHGVGHLLESQGTQFKATGLIEDVCDWLDSKQLDTGLWQPIDPLPYTALSGILKIGSFYNIAGRQMNYCDKMVDAAIDVILRDDDPIYVILVYNPWGGLRYAFINMEKANKSAAERGESMPYDIQAARQKVYDRLPEMIDKTIEKLSKFRHPDGSFSYCQKHSASHTQGTLVSLGYEEGDVNGTALAMNTMSNTIFEVLGLNRVPLYDDNDYDNLINTMLNAKPPKKNKVPKEVAEALNIKV